MFQVNVDGPFLTTWAVKDEMIRNRFGRIVNLASIAGMLMKKDFMHYATTKAAVISFTRHCSEAFAPHNVRVNCVAPGLTDTEMARFANQGVFDKLVAGTPLLTSDCPGLREVVRDTPAVLAPAGDVAAWTDALAAMSAAPPVEAVRAYVPQAVARYDAARTAERTVEAINDVAARAEPGA